VRSARARWYDVWRAPEVLRAVSRVVTLIRGHPRAHSSIVSTIMIVVATSGGSVSVTCA
jgi:hypothetical protein